jgi:EpsD family peptidyl-prolyl cis-trans isomerase
VVKEFKVHKSVAIWVIPLLILLAGCGKDSDSRVLARVNETKITGADLEREIDQLPFHSRTMLQSPQAQGRLLDEMVKRELLMQEAEKRKLASQPEIRARLEESRRSILLNALLTQEIRDKVKIEEPEVRSYFDKHRDELETSEIHLRQILLKNPQEAEQMHARLLKKESFEDLARQFSQDKPSASKGGDLGFVSRGQMPPELERVAFSMQPQEISAIIKTPKGYHILKLIERKKTVTLNYEEIKDRLKPFAQAEKQRDRLETWLKELRNEAKVNVYEARLPVSLKTQPGRPQETPDVTPGKPSGPPSPSSSPSTK